MSDNYAHKRYAELEQEPKENERRVWRGFYRGVRFEINNFKMGDDKYVPIKDCWTHYLIISLDEQLPKEWADKFWLEPKYMRFRENGPEHLTYDYFDSVVASLDWHGGCTFYEKLGGPDTKERIVKMGCDYQHLWDEGREYSLAYVHGKVKKTIDSLYELVGGKVKIRSLGDGKYRYWEEFEESEVRDESQ